ncbi:unnamed protein product [Soboliphyme baturini]|uniref:DUF3291 domain-containing protein n=1 Tax=Soboliphyme baturini TaxID=241478 RepID=A0A183J6Z9_9BILA|nr:unnamed protein product [Soboliphyme baturini]
MYQLRARSPAHRSVVVLLQPFIAAVYWALERSDDSIRVRAASPDERVPDATSFVDGWHHWHAYKTEAHMSDLG